MFMSSDKKPFQFNKLRFEKNGAWNKNLNHEFGHCLGMSSPVFCLAVSGSWLIQ